MDSQTGVTPAGAERFDAVIVGAGFAGLYMLHKVRQLGLSAIVFEAGSGVGGTWFWNRYPGARCDVDSLEYSYSFDDDIQQEWSWTERFATSRRSCAISTMSPTGSTCAATYGWRPPSRRPISTRRARSGQ